MFFLRAVPLPVCTVQPAHDSSAYPPRTPTPHHDHDGNFHDDNDTDDGDDDDYEPDGDEATLTARTTAMRTTTASMTVATTTASLIRRIRPLFLASPRSG